MVISDVRKRKVYRLPPEMEQTAFHINTGLKINEKIQSQFCDKIPKFSRNLATFSCRIFTLHFHVSGLAKLNMSLQYLCVKKLLKMAND